MSEDEKKGFWQTLPGIITGITALITAIAGLIIALTQTGIIGNKPTVAATVPDQPVKTSSLSSQKEAVHNDSFDFEDKTPGKKLLQVNFNKPQPFELNGVEFNITGNRHRVIDENTFGMLLFVNIKPNHNGGSREKLDLVENGVAEPVVGQKNKSILFVSGATIEEIYRVQGKIGAALSMRFQLNNFVKEIPFKVEK